MAQRQYGVVCHAAPTARDAVDGAQLVVGSEPDAYVTTLGPKQQGRAEFGRHLPAVAALVVTDSPSQMDAYDPPNVWVLHPLQHQTRTHAKSGAIRSSAGSTTWQFRGWSDLQRSPTGINARPCPGLRRAATPKGRGRAVRA